MTLSRLEQAAVYVITGADWAPAILGDLEEQMATAARPKLWFWQQVLSSVFPLLAVQIRRLDRVTLFSQCTAFLVAILAIVLWEAGIARTYSWPIAKNWVAYSPLSVGDTCRLTYVALYGGFSVLIMASFSLCAKRFDISPNMQFWQTIALACLASLPALFLIAFPLASDGALWFRLAQLLAVWGGALLLLHRALLRLDLQDLY